MNSQEHAADATDTDAAELAVGEFKLDLVRRRLRDGFGVPVELSPRLFDALVYFVEHRGQLLDKDRLLSALWPGQVVEENNLNKAVSALRRALGDDGESKRYLLTVPRRGFRFIAEVRPLPTPAARSTAGDAASPAGPPAPSVAAGPAHADATPPPHRRRAIVAGAALAAAGTLAASWLWRRRFDDGTGAPTTLAVLPFRPLAGAPRDELLELGMADSLITRLSAGRGVIVRPVAAVRRFAGGEVDPLRVAHDLGVAWVLEGTVQRAGERTRVTARLLDAANGTAAWSGSFDETVSHVFDVQDAISRRVAEVLMPRLSERERGLVSSAGTRNAEAYRLYLEARVLSQLFTPDAFSRSIVLYEQAIAVDPRYAYAYVGLADVHRRTQFTSDTPPRETFEAIRRAADRAVELDPLLGDGQAMRGWVAYWYEWDWPRAEEVLRHARALNPSSIDAHHGLAHVLMSTGRFPEALESFTRARQIDPLSLIANVLEGGMFAVLDRIDEALASIERALRINSGFWIGHLFLGNLLFTLDRTAPALAALRRAVELSHGSAWAIGPLGYALAATGQGAEARELLRAMQARSRSAYVSPSTIALVYAGLGETEAAMSALEQAHAVRDIRLVFLQTDHRWAALRKLPRFAALAARLKLDGVRPPARSPF